MRLWRAPTGDLVIDVEKLIGLKVVAEGSGANRKFVLYGMTNTRDIEMLRADETEIRKAYSSIVSWVAPPPTAAAAVPPAQLKVDPQLMDNLTGKP